MLVIGALLPPADAPFKVTSGVEVLNPAVAVNVLPLIVPGVAILAPAVAAFCVASAELTLTGTDGKFCADTMV